MKETGMLFKAEMVRALLDGRKTQTRRIIKDQPKVTESRLKQLGAWNPDLTLSQHVNQAFQSGFVDVKCPFGQVGDRIWVRETWQHSNYPFGPYEDGCDVFYRADFLNDVHGPDGELSPEGRYRFWNASIHMPRTASRIMLEITDVRIERLQDISEEDAKAEGCYWSDGKPESGVPTELMVEARMSFEHLWNSTGGDWNANPWVWVYEFKQIKTGAAA